MTYYRDYGWKRSRFWKKTSNDWVARDNLIRSELCKKNPAENQASFCLRLGIDPKTMKRMVRILKSEREIQDAIRVLEDEENQIFAPALYLEAFRILDEVGS